MKRTTFVDAGIVVVIIYALFWILIGSYYLYPTAEDLEVTFISRDQGVIKGAIKMLNSFDGRYTTNILHGLNPLAFGWYYGHKLMPIATLLLLMLSVFGFLNSYFSHKSKLENGLFSIALTMVFFSVLNLSNSFYWMISSFVYLYPIIFFLLFYSFYLNYIKEEKWHQLILSQFFLFLSLGCNELYLIIIGLFLFYQLLVHYQNAKCRNVLFSFLIIYIISSFLFVSSPGIHNRLMLFEDERKVVFSNFWENILDFTFSVLKCMSSIVFLSFIFLFIGRYRMRFDRPKLLVSILFFLFIVVEIVLLALIGLEGFHDRTLPVFVPLLMILIFLIFSKWNPIFKQQEILLVFVFLISFFCENHSINHIRQDYYSGKLEVYKNIMDEMYLDLTNANIENGIEVVKLKNIAGHLPGSIATPPIIYPNRSRSYWNIAYENYFDIDEVRLENDTTPLLLNRFNEIKH